MRKQLLTAAAMVRRSATGMATTTAWGGRRRRPAVCLPGGRRSGRYVGHMTEAPEDFEYERRFFVRDLPRAILGEEPPAVIVQTYFLAQDGYGLRLRLQASAPRQRLDPASRADDALAQFAGEFDLCVLTAKGPYVGGTRYEAERELDIGMGIEMSKRGGATIAKSRYSVWLDEDGWVIDEFAGANRPLIIAECERGGPVVDLRNPVVLRHRGDRGPAVLQRRAGQRVVLGLGLPFRGGARLNRASVRHGLWDQPAVTGLMP